MKTSNTIMSEKLYRLAYLPLLLTLLCNGILLAQIKSAAEFIQEARSLQAANELPKATDVMNEAAAQYPNDNLILAYQGLYTGMLAGEYQDTDFSEAGRLVMLAFQILDKAVSRDTTHVQARLFRGTLRINVPEFLGYLDLGIRDLNTVLRFFSETPQRVTLDERIMAYQQLALAYGRKGGKDDVISALKNIIKLAPQSPAAHQAENQIKRLSTETSEKSNTESPSEDLSELYLKGEELVESEKYHEAINVYKEIVQRDSTNVNAYLSLIQVLGYLAEIGYDDSIYKDQDLRINLALDVMNWLDRAVQIAPENAELRLIRGSVGVQMPFFVNKITQSIDDLNTILQSDQPDSMKAEALYWLGMAHQKKSLTIWNRIAKEYKDQPAYRNVLSSMRPRIQRLDTDNLKNPYVTIEFILGFQDELPPQTAIWVEDERDNYIKTIYVSGFSSHVKEKQIVLPRWARSSDFKGVDGVTSASIETGAYMYAWDLSNLRGSRVKKGLYRINVEVHFWPSNKYQTASADIQVGKKDDKAIIERGDYIPYLEIQYISN